jgi:hypothetical protein
MGWLPVHHRNETGLVIGGKYDISTFATIVMKHGWLLVNKTKFDISK